jgi:hypothetical protein
MLGDGKAMMSCLFVGSRVNKPHKYHAKKYHEVGKEVKYIIK